MHVYRLIANQVMYGTRCLMEGAVLADPSSLRTRKTMSWPGLEFESAYAGPTAPAVAA
jgi:hypothetical protein